MVTWITNGLAWFGSVAHPFHNLERAHPVLLKIVGFVLPLFSYVVVRLRKQLTAWVNYASDLLIIYPINRWVKRFVAARASLRKYCQISQYDPDLQYLFVPARHEIKLKIVDIFIPLQLESRDTGPRLYTHRDLLSLANRIRIVGDPGSGKSSLLRRLFLDCCDSGLHKPNDSRLPCLVSLGKLSIPARKQIKLGDWLFEHIRGTVEASSVAKMRECFNAWAEGPGLLVLLDGLDEVSSAQFERVQIAIDQLGEKLAKLSDSNVIVLTMRVQFYQQIRERARYQPGNVVSVKPFAPSDIYDFLSKWRFAEGQSALRHRIYGDLSDRPTLREMCTNPLVLSMFVASYGTSLADLSRETRTQFYSRVAEELLIERRLKQIQRPAAPVKRREQRFLVLGQAAYEHLLNPAQPSNSLAVQSARKIIRARIKPDSSEAESYFRELAKETGMVSDERKDETFRFIHLTFCEFLAAWFAVRAKEKGFETLCRTHARFQKDSNPQTRSRLLEVIPFASGLLYEKERKNALALVQALNDDRLSARCFLETKAYDDESWAAFIENTKQDLLSTSPEKWDHTWLSNLHLLNVVVQDAHETLVETPEKVGLELSQFYGELLRSHPERMAALFESYARQDAAAAFRLAELLGVNLPSQFPGVVLNSCDQLPFLDTVVERIASVPHERNLWAALLTEAALRARVVAQTLHGREIDARLPKPKRSRGWVHGALIGFLGERLYAQVVALALETSAQPMPVLEGSTPLLNLLRSARVRFDPQIEVIGACCLIAIPVALVFILGPQLSWPKIALLPNIVSIAAALLVYLGLFVLISVLAKHRDIRIAFNISDPDDFPSVLTLIMRRLQMLGVRSFSERKIAAIIRLRETKVGPDAPVATIETLGDGGPEPNAMAKGA